MTGRYWTSSGDLVDVCRFPDKRGRFLIGKEIVSEAEVAERIASGALRRFGLIASAQPRSEEKYIGPRWNRKGNR